MKEGEKTMTKPADDLEAIRIVIQALEPFDSKDRERIIRWAAEKLGMSSSPTLAPASASTLAAPQHPAAVLPAAAGSVSKDIRSFVMTKKPKSDNQMAAVVAYFYHFEAPPAERKDSIGKEELMDACRKADRKRSPRPEQVLVNTYHAGLLDKAGSAGQYRLNSVGENLVAMVLPEQITTDATSSRKSKGKRATRRVTKKIKGRSISSKAK
ncbi:MAG: hypothetical protein A2X34_08825 [Elusimicrobia bacterium GWC2_51_8]|nr:MAG: hypothetical protein A2X33_10575 [Elusimicrobia bacterium GWA2_51_34]OGR59993.1 MAG: hypothetical protein A2X34_08825 [Elusimicrobia bacterium GWC2_51_8]OGR86319.1 MAG: hypothetical protein A2021_06765 [Elusimicrobia bacterium GWF2_52_66]HAF95182.1 hypothetical protein [Elusimicrobiota bacterium]HCE98390.1 hypothetical protein [Elusimicrobiota bacterium]